MEEPVFTYNFTLNANKVETVNTYINILKHDDSQTSLEPNLKRIQDRLEGLKTIKTLAMSHSISKESFCFTLSFWFWNVFIGSIKTKNNEIKKYLLENLFQLAQDIQYSDTFWKYCEKQNTYFSKWLKKKDYSRLIEFQKFSKIEQLRLILKHT